MCQAPGIIALDPGLSTQGPACGATEPFIPEEQERSSLTRSNCLQNRQFEARMTRLYPLGSRGGYLIAGFERLVGPSAPASQVKEANSEEDILPIHTRGRTVARDATGGMGGYSHRVC